jgi:ankyrin repeat protein
MQAFYQMQNCESNLLYLYMDQDTRTPLHWAASVGAVDVTRYLLDHGAEIDKGDGSGWTPLHIAGE